jgi:hypothetical protein
VTEEGPSGITGRMEGTVTEERTFVSVEIMTCLALCENCVICQAGALVITVGVSFEWLQDPERTVSVFLHGLSSLIPFMSIPPHLLFLLLQAVAVVPPVAVVEAPVPSWWMA